MDLNLLSSWLHRGAPLLLAIAVLAGALCIGTLFSVGWLADRARLMADEIAGLALQLFARRTVPCFFLATLAAAGWLEGTHRELAHDPLVLTVAALTLALVVVHVRVAARARRVATQY